MHIVAVRAVAGEAGFFYDDQAAIRAGAEHDGFGYRGGPVTAGYAAIRQPAAAVSVLLVLSDGQVALGDCVSVQYSGAGGRDPLFSAELGVSLIRRHIAPALIGRSVHRFRELADLIEDLRIDGNDGADGADGAGLPAAVRYGVSQALLDAVARSRRTTMAEVIRDEYATGSALQPVPVYTQSGDERYLNVDKMILKQVDVLPHGLINNVKTKLGVRGEILAEYLAWVRDRVLTLRTDQTYSPLLHLDLYGTAGLAFDHDVEVVADYLTELGRIAEPFALSIEHPIDAGSRSAQIDTFVRLRAALAARGSTVRLAVDEWCNTLDDIAEFVRAGAADIIHVKTPDLGGIGNTVQALLLVREAGLASLCGGSCAETEVSARVCAQVAMACEADMVLAKPGMGVDEGLMIVRNEMRRVSSLAHPV